MKKSILSTSELADHLGLSRWSVSRAINDQSGVSDETKAQVRAAMEKFAFVPSPHGRGLRGHRTGAIGACFRELATPVTIQKIAQIQRLLSGRGYRPLFEFAELDQRRGGDVIRHFISMRVEGVVLVDMPTGTQTNEWMRLLAEYEIPVVSVEPLGGVGANAVHLDREAAMARLAQELLAHGHRRFALLGISRRFPLGRPRVTGVNRALAAAGLVPQRAVEVIDNPAHRYGGLRYGRELAELYLARRTRATALLALNDEVAAGALWHLQKAGLHCPRDFSLVGFDNLVLSEQTSPGLTTIDHNVEAVGAAAVDLLCRIVESAGSAKLPVVKIEPRLIVRESVAAPPARSR